MRWYMEIAQLKACGVNFCATPPLLMIDPQGRRVSWSRAQALEPHCQDSKCGPIIY